MIDYNGDELFGVLVGKTVRNITGLDVGSESVVFVCTDDTKYEMTYHHDCCASCSILDIVGDVADLIGRPILKAEAHSNSDAPPEDGVDYDSYTWTFYSLRTDKGAVDIRWFGESNGYYSERATFEEIK